MAKRDRSHSGRRNFLAKPLGKGFAVHRHDARRRGNETRHRPVVIHWLSKPAMASSAKIRVRVRMIPRELDSIVGGTTRAKQRCGPRMMQVNIVEHGETGISEEVRPLVVVVRRISHLVDRQIVRARGGAAR